MTNREYMESLSDEELAECLGEQNWVDDCYFRSAWDNIPYIDALKEWLNIEHERE